ncbi:MAG TPA: peptidylprolyl isomerase [Pyrinomonadaceae bacterium]|nr:peptidylprolyl isomerase [Pyrinomonadaceae bacterium]
MKRLVGGESFSCANVRSRVRLLAACVALSLVALSCGGAETGSKDFDDAAGANVKQGVKPEPDAEAAVLETTFGRVVIELYPNLAPKMVERFKTLAKQGFYDGTAFHRINPQAGVVQGGDPNSKDDDPANDGMGGSDLPDLPAEFSDIPYERGIVGAARSSDPNSANSQFYITLRRVPQWDGQYTVFGRVIEGMSNADVIAGAPTRPGSENPADKILIQSVKFQPRANFK